MIDAEGRAMETIEETAESAVAAEVDDTGIEPAQVMAYVMRAGWEQWNGDADNTYYRPPLDFPRALAWSMAAPKDRISVAVPRRKTGPRDAFAAFIDGALGGFYIRDAIRVIAKWEDRPAAEVEADIRKGAKQA